MCEKRCISMPAWHWGRLEYWAELAEKDSPEHANVSAQVRLAVVDRTRTRHDYATPLQGMLLLAELLVRGGITRHEAAGQIKKLVEGMNALRRDDDKEKAGASGAPASGAKPPGCAGA